MLADFNSLFEVSIGIHVAYSLIRDINDRPSVFHDRHYALLRSHHANGIISGPTTNWATKMELFKIDIAKNSDRVDKYVKWSTGVAIFSMLWLLLSAFRPDENPPACLMGLVVGIALLPMPAFMTITHVNCRKIIQDINKTYMEAFGRQGP